MPKDQESNNDYMPPPPDSLSSLPEDDSAITSSKSEVTVENAADIVKRELGSSPGGLQIPANMDRGIPSAEEAEKMEKYSDQTSGPQAAAWAGVEGYIPSSPPETARQPERPKRSIYLFLKLWVREPKSASECTIGT